MLIPETEDWEQVKKIVMKKRMTKTEYRRFSNISASLPKSIYELGILHYFDDDALEKNILLPKMKYLDEVYDKTLGTDKWLVC